MMDPAQTMVNDELLLADGVALANIPTLLLVLVQITGDLRWLEPPYQPSRSRGMSDNDSGDLAPDIQREIRDAALDAILTWRAGRPPAIPEPPEDLLLRMLAVSMGEPIPPEYAPMLLADLGPTPTPQPMRVPEGFHAIVIGAGVSGLCAAYSLLRAGVPFTVIERSATVGGVWRENRYPGAGVDSPNHLYSFSFAPYDWSQYFVLRGEIQSYLEHVATEFGLRPNIRLCTEVTNVSYCEDEQSWTVIVETPDGTTKAISADVVISAVGVFNPPLVPPISGLHRFEGPAFHTAQWPDGVDIHGKRVALVGNGASAMQVGPAIADSVASLTIFQRSPQWAAPFEKFQQPVPEPVRYLLREVPMYRAWYRVRLGWIFGDKNFESLQKDPHWEHQDQSLNAINDAHRRYFTRYILSELGEREDLAHAVVPNYPPFGKRMLMDNGWYRMLTRENVTLVTDRIREVRSDRIVTDSDDEHEVDVLILATGFDVLHYLNTFEVRGRSGKKLAELWEDNARAYLGLTIPGFPNLFCLYGPNTQPGHGGSLIAVIETSVRYLMSLLSQMFAKDIGVVECRTEVFERYNQMVDQAHEGMVWTHPGTDTYYRNSRGRVVVNMSCRAIDWWHMTKQADLDDYLVEPRRHEGR